MLLGVMLSAPATEVHRWTDANGAVHFGDRPPPEAKTEIIETRINTYTSPNIERLEGAVAGNTAVVMYATSWCGVCKRAKAYFRAHKIPYKYYDVETSEKGKRDFKKLGGKGVPVILVGTRRLNGFSESAFEKIHKRT